MKRSWSRISALIMGIPLLLALIVACGPGTEGPSQAGGTPQPGQEIDIKIATDFPVSGKDTANGKPAENGAHYAVDEANSQNFLPGYNFVFVPKDDVGAGGSHDPTVGQRNTTELIGDAQVAGIVGPLNSSVAVSMMPVANNAPIAMISPANTNNCLTQTTPEAECGGAKNQLPTLRPTGKVTYFRIATLDKYQGSVLAEYGYEEKGYRTAYIVDDTETYGAGIAENFKLRWEALGGRVLGHDKQKSTTSYEGLLTKIATTNPDVIFFGGNDSTGALPMRRQMVSIPALKDTPFIAGDGVKNSTMAAGIVPTGGGPVYSSVAAVDVSALPAAKNFIDGYNKTYGAQNFGSYTAGGYDSAWILMKAVKAVIDAGQVPAPSNSDDAEAAKKFRQAVIDAIMKVEHEGVTGKHTFDQNGDTTNKAISVYTLGDPKVGDGWKFVTQRQPEA